MLTFSERLFVLRHGDLPALRRAKRKAHKAQTALHVLYAALAVSAFAITIYRQQPVTVELAAYTWSGDRYTAGTGDSCMAAFEGAAIPEDWRALKCESFDVFGFTVGESR